MPDGKLIKHNVTRLLKGIANDLFGQPRTFLDKRWLTRWSSEEAKDFIVTEALKDEYRKWKK